MVYSMGGIVDMRDFQASRAARRAAKCWSRLFPEKLDARVMLGDLCDRTILTLAHVGDDASNILTGVIILLLDFGGDGDFEVLSGQDKMQVLDRYLFLIDQIRWECLLRVGWASGFAAERYPMVELVLRYDAIRSQFNPPFPHISATHQSYSEFIQRCNLDGEAMVRGLIPAALASLAMRV